MLVSISAIALVVAGQPAAEKPAPPPPIVVPTAPRLEGTAAPRRAPLRLRVQPRAPIGTWFSQDDYPASALRGREEGTTRFRVEIDPTGRVSRCDVQQTSGSNALDNATCRILRSRARFLPAVDIEGNPASDHYFGGLAWNLDGPVRAVAWTPPQSAPSAARVSATRGATPAAGAAPALPMRPLQSLIVAADYPAPALAARQEGRTTYRLAIGPDGRVTGCVVLGSSGSSALDSATCRLLRSRGRFTPARDDAGHPVGDDYFGEYVWRLPR
jgi:TonB family protein